MYLIYMGHIFFISVMSTRINRNWKENRPSRVNLMVKAAFLNLKHPQHHQAYKLLFVRLTKVSRAIWWEINQILLHQIIKQMLFQTGTNNIQSTLRVEIVSRQNVVIYHHQVHRSRLPFILLSHQYPHCLLTHPIHHRWFQHEERHKILHLEIQTAKYPEQRNLKEEMNILI